MNLNYEYGVVFFFLFKIFGIICGLVSIYFGYDLFKRGVFDKSGEFRAEYMSGNLILKSVAPGSFFALIGAIIIISVVISGYEFHVTDGYQGTKKPSLP